MVLHCHGQHLDIMGHGVLTLMDTCCSMQCLCWSCHHDAEVGGPSDLLLALLVVKLLLVMLPWMQCR